jgi:cell division transport system ATP-binding protein
VHENLRFVLQATGWQDERLIEEKINDVLDKVGLKSKGFKMPFEMSGGEQQRVDIARALLNSPKLILADEPTGNLDSKTSEEVMELFGKIHAAGNTVILVTHEEEIARYAHRVVRLRDGNLETDTLNKQHI